MAQDRTENAIKSLKTPRTKGTFDISSVPDDIRQRFIQRGPQFHLPDGTHVFTDRGKRLISASENTEIIRSLIHIAQARGWNSIRVTGTERFRKETWMAAELAGLKVSGYKPTQEQQALLVRRIANPTPSTPRDPALEEFIWVGKLIDHGPAPYRHDSKQAISYFVRLETKAGETEVWGVDLERALKQSASRPQIGDEVGLRSLGQKPVTVSVPTRDADGHVNGERKLKTHRRRWVVEQSSFLHERAAVANIIRDPDVAPARAVKAHPALIGTYLAIHAAELASKHFRDPQDQARFIAIVREGLADSIERGEPLQALRLRERTPSPHTPARDLEQAHGR